MIRQAKKLTSQLDKLATTIQSQHKALGIPKKIAMDFAYRCDILSDGIEKRALDEYDPVQEEGFDPEDIGREDAGPLFQFDSDEDYMDENFTAQEFRELRELQESGRRSDVQLEPRLPREGKQASYKKSLSRLRKMASEMGNVHSVSRCIDALELCCSRLENQSDNDSVDKICKLLERHVASLKKFRELLIAQEGSGEHSWEVETCAETALGAVEEILPYLKSFVSEIVEIDETSPISKMLSEDQIEEGSERLTKLLSLGAKILSDALKQASGKSIEKEANAPF